MEHAGLWFIVKSPSLSLFTLYDYDRFPRKRLKNNDIEFDFSTIKDKCILANRQELEINEKVDKIAIAGSSLLCAIKDKIKIIYEDDSYDDESLDDDVIDDDYADLSIVDEDELEEEN